MTAQAIHTVPNPRTRGAIRGLHQARKDVLTMLRNDHRLMDSAFRECERLHRAQETASYLTLVQQTCMELELHTHLEEDVFYPGIRHVLENPEQVDESEVEHQTLKMLIAQLRTTDPADEKFSATFTVLREYVKHHVREEEGSLFRKLTRAKLDWHQLLEDMQEQREVLIERMLTDTQADNVGQLHHRSTRDTYINETKQ